MVYKSLETSPLPYQKRVNRYSPIPTTSKNCLYRRRKFYERAHAVLSVKPLQLSRSEFLILNPKGFIWPKYEPLPIYYDSPQSKAIYSCYRHIVAEKFKRIYKEITPPIRLFGFYKDNPCYTTPEWLCALKLPWFLSFVGKPRPWDQSRRQLSSKCNCALWNVVCPHYHLE